MVTLKDVARLAEVSTSTASLVLDERLPTSNTAAAQRVRKVAAELGYVRNPFASSLRRSDASTIGVIVPRLTDTVMLRLVVGRRDHGEQVARRRSRRDLFTLGYFAAAFSAMTANATAGGIMLSDAIGKGASAKSKAARIFSGVILVWGIAITAIFGDKSPVELIVLAQSLTVLTAPGTGLPAGLPVDQG